MKLEAHEVHEFPPLWEKFPYFFSLIFRRSALLFSGFGSVLMYLNLTNKLYLLLGWPVVAYVLLFGGYVFDILLRTSQGHLGKDDGPQFGYSGLGLGVRAMMVFILDYVLIAGVIWLIAGSLNRVFTQQGYHAVLFGSPAVYLICLLITPAQWIILAQTRSVTAALELPRIGATLAACGSRYVLILLFQLVLNASALEVITLLKGHAPLPIMAIALAFLQVGNWIITMAMIGYVCLERHGDLDIKISAQTAKKVLASGKNGSKSLPLDPVSDIFAEVGVLVGTGDNRGALRLLRTALQRHWGHEALHEQYFKLAVLNGEAGEIMGMIRDYVSFLVHSDKHDQALIWYLRGLELSPRFQPTNPGDVFLLAQEAERAGALATALQLVEHLLADEPRHPLRADALLLKGRVLLASGLTAEATAVLLEVQQRHPDHPASVMADRYLNPGNPAYAPPAAG